MRYRACQLCSQSIGAVNIGGNLALTAVKGYLGVVGGSQALVADAIHSLADLLSSGLLLVGLRVAHRPANAKHPYGYGKVEFLVAVGIYALLLAAGGFIIYDSVHMIVDKQEVSPSGITIFGALLSAVVNEMMYRQSLCVGRQLQSPSIVANAAEKRADVYSSLAVLAGIVGAKLGVHVLDPLAAVLVAALILHSSLKGSWTGRSSRRCCSAWRPRRSASTASPAWGRCARARSASASGSSSTSSPPATGRFRRRRSCAARWRAPCGAASTGPARWWSTSAPTRTR